MSCAFIDARPAGQWRVVKTKKKWNIVVPSADLYVTQFLKNRHIYILNSKNNGPPVTRCYGLLG